MTISAGNVSGPLSFQQNPHRFNVFKNIFLISGQAGLKITTAWAVVISSQQQDVCQERRSFGYTCWLTMMMRYRIAVILIMLVAGCSSRPEPVDVLLRSDGTTVVKGAYMTDVQLLDLANTIRFNHGQSFPLTIRADAGVTLAQIENVASIIRRSGLFQIRIGRSDSDAVAYPTKSTNEWVWDGLFADADSVSIKTNWGVNVRILSDGAKIESSPTTMQELLTYLVSLAGNNRAKVVITAETNAPLSSLISVLETCEENHIDHFYIEHWLEQYLITRQGLPGDFY